MIGRKEWFTRRKYSGWGLTPKTWQGFVYIAIAVAIGFTINNLQIPSGLKTTLIAAYIVILVADILHIMATIKIDEREAKIEALTERNAAWAMVAALAILIAYFSTTGDSKTATDLTPYLLFPLIAGFITKSLSALILQRKEL